MTENNRKNNAGNNRAYHKKHENYTNSPNAKARRIKRRRKQIQKLILSCSFVLVLILAFQTGYYLCGHIFADKASETALSSTIETESPTASENLTEPDEYLSGNSQETSTFKFEAGSDSPIPQSLLEMYEKYPETKDFVYDYPAKGNLHPDIDLQNEVEAGTIPLFIQWDERWGYEKYGNDFLGVNGCGPTALSMVYVGLTGDTSMNPLAMAQLAEKQGYYVNGSGSSWSMMTKLAKKLGLSAKEVIFDEEHILAELKKGKPLICIMGAGDFTDNGHFLVLTGIADNGEIIIHDPNSRLNSSKTWQLSTLMSQMKNLWAYSYRKN